MNITIAETNDELAEIVARDLLHFIRSIPYPLICTASGDSPAGLYRNLAQKVKSKELSVRNWKFVGLDEWAGMDANTEGSCRYHLNKDLFDPLQIPADNICFFNGKANLDEECTRTDNFIKNNGGIAVAITGLGLNGHIGMNEPECRTDLYSHIADIHPQTQQTGQKYFKQPQVLTQGITLGITSLMEARHVFLIVNGSHKAEIVKEVLEGPETERVPASLMRRHPGFSVYLDKAAAQYLKK